MKKNKIITFLLYLYSFYIIYSPNFFSKIGVENIYILFFLFLVQLFLYLKKDKKIKDLIGIHGMVFCSSIFLISLYFVVVALCNGISFFDVKNLRIVQNNMPIVYYFNVSFLIYYLKNKGYTPKRILDFFFNTLSIQGIICILMMLFPFFRNIALNLYPLSDNHWIVVSRIYGITFDYTYGTQIFHGLICTFLCIFAVTKDKKYFAFLPLILLPSILNGRTGILIFLITFFIFIASYFVKQKKISALIKYSLVCCFIVLLLLVGLKFLFPYTYNIFKMFFNDTIMFLTGKGLSGNYSVLFNEMLFFPNGIHLLFGHGIKVFDNVNLFGNSDIGYVNDIFLGGLIFAGWLYSTYFILFKKTLQSSEETYFSKIFLTIIVISFLIINIKGEVFRSSVIVTGILFVIRIVELMNCEKKELKESTKQILYEDVMVSVCCLTYNQCTYISQTLDSILAQKTNFNYEIVVHDDCSSDGTVEILKEYQKKYPKIVKVIYEKENQYSKNPRVLRLCYPKVNGKYIALCEGDDYWCDPYKLQKQFNFMETHNDCSLVVHGNYLLNTTNNQKTKKIQPYAGSRYYSTDEILRGDGGIFATNSMFFKFEHAKTLPDYYKNAPIGDLPIMMYLSTVGKVYYMDDYMSVYRVNAIGSWSVAQFLSSSRETLIKKQQKFYDDMAKMINDFNVETNYKYYKAGTDYLLIKEYIYFLIIDDIDSINDDKFKRLYKIFTFREAHKKLKLFVVRKIPKLYRFLKERK